jgi:diketogulonate reductase-like aldo/keto reductase
MSDISELNNMSGEDATAFTLRTGDKMPKVGLGTWKGDAVAVKAAVEEALKAGYRHLDCACDYGNEEAVGAAIATSLTAGVCTREELWVTSKLWNTYHAKEHVEAACRKTLADLGLDYLDLYLIHFPISLKFVPFEKRYPPEWIFDPDAADPQMVLSDVPISETWAAMENLKKKGLVKNIGVSNFNCQSLMDLLKYCEIAPAVNQVESHPYFQQRKLLQYCKHAGILITAFSPLGSSSYIELGMAKDVGVLNEESVSAIGKKHNKTPAQVVLRWNVQRGASIVPKSTNANRLVENLSIFDFELDDAEMATVAALERNIRYNDPGEFAKGFGGPWAEMGYPIYG